MIMTTCIAEWVAYWAGRGNGTLVTLVPEAAA